jgi:Lamin Tail Domain
MKAITLNLIALIGVLLTFFSTPTYSSIVITEVAPWSSENSSVAADWFELTNIGNSFVDISGWRIANSSNSFSSSVALTDFGVDTIMNPGESMIVLGDDPQGAPPLQEQVSGRFWLTWYGIGQLGWNAAFYDGTQASLSTDGDAINLYDSTGVLQANVSFGVSDAVFPLQTFDNSAGLNNAALTRLSSEYLSFNGKEIGNPVSLSNVPIPAAFWFFGSSILGLIKISHKRKVTQFSYQRTIVLGCTIRFSPTTLNITA